MKTLLVLGYGYSARFFASVLSGWHVIGVTRDADKAAQMCLGGVEAVVWPADLGPYLARATHVLASAAPDEAGDPFLAAAAAQIAAARHLDWVGYLSTTGVYGDSGGAWLDEGAPLSGATVRGQRRIAAEAAWRALDLPLHIFRLAGIYGPGRGPFAKVRAGVAQRVIKEGQFFSRIHVEDIAQVLLASIARPNPGAVYNVCDDDPVAPQDVITYAAELLGVDLPPEVPFEAADLSPMARSFYAESKRISNRRIKEELGVCLRYPTYRAGLEALLHAGDH